MQDNKQEISAQHSQIPKDPDKNDPEVKKSLAITAKLGSFGLFLGFACIIGFILGRWLDRQFNTYPWLTVFLSLCGVAASILEFIKIVKEAKKVPEE